MIGRLKDKVALITGGCSGMGLATAQLFIAEGARVIVADILKDPGAALEKRYPGKLGFGCCDVTREEDVAAAVELAVNKFGGLDIVSNNAGVVGTTDTFENMQAEHWDHTMNLLLRGVMFGVKHAIGPMKARGGGSIINTASVSGVSTNGPATYCIAKAGVLHLTHLAALELAPYRIRVNSILPGFFPTAIYGVHLGLTHEQSLRMAAAMTQQASQLQPLPIGGSQAISRKPACTSRRTPQSSSPVQKYGWTAAFY